MCLKTDKLLLLLNELKLVSIDAKLIRANIFQKRYRINKDIIAWELDEGSA